MDLGIIDDIGKTITGFVDSLFDGADDLITSDEEILVIKEKIKAGINDLTKTIVAAVTARWDSDNKSDSWWTKNIRPLAFAFTLLNYFILQYVSIFLVNDLGTLNMVKEWTGSLENILMCMVFAYYGSRGIEKSISTLINRAKGNK